MTEPRSVPVGFWMVRVVNNGPEIPARLWWEDAEPGFPDNKVDQPYLQGELGTELTNPFEIIEMLEFVEASPAEQRLMANPPPSERAPRDGRQQALTSAPMALWKRLRARRITEAEHRFQVADLRHSQAYRPEEPKVRPNRPVDLMTAPLPF